MNKILIIHGPNLNLLGQREKGIYGKRTLKEINTLLERDAKAHKMILEIVQSNHEGELVDIIGQAKQKGIKAIVINPAAYPHPSVAIRDAIAAVKIPTVEVHLSNIYAREEFRQHSLISPVAVGQISGFGMDSYLLGLAAAIKLIKK